MAKSWKYAAMKQMVKVSAYLMGRTQKQPFHQVGFPPLCPAGAMMKP